MLRLSAYTDLTPEQVVEKEYFHKGLGLEMREDSECCLTFTGGGGYVAITAEVSEEEKRTEATIETREWDYDVKKFARSIS